MIKSRRVAILGSTGSIGRTALRVLTRQRDRFSVTALTAHSNATLLAEQAGDWNPSYVGLVAPGVDAMRDGWHSGQSALVDAATRDDVDIVLNAVVGVAGMDATLAALEAGKRVALANKETLVVAGELATAACARSGGEIVPVDSEHSAILQCLGVRRIEEVRRLINTAYEKAKAVLIKHKVLLVKMAQKLVEVETLEGPELEAMFSAAA